MPTKTCALVERLQTIADPRRQGENLKHPLVDVIIVGFCGVLAGCEDFVETADGRKGTRDFLAPFSSYPTVLRRMTCLIGSLPCPSRPRCRTRLSRGC